MGATVRHHFVPQHYLRAFADSSERLLAVQKIEQPEFINTSVRKTGFQGGFYTIDPFEGETDRASVENGLSKVESSHAQALRSIVQGEELTSKLSSLLWTSLH